jgi:hypothetical protein
VYLVGPALAEVGARTAPTFRHARSGGGLVGTVLLGGAVWHAVGAGDALRGLAVPEADGRRCPPPLFVASTVAATAASTTAQVTAMAMRVRLLEFMRGSPDVK